MRLPSGRTMILVLVALASLLTGCDFGSSVNDSGKPASQIKTPDYTGNKDRWLYQNAMNNSPIRIDPHFEVVEYDNALWVRQDVKRGSCRIRCGVAVYRNGAYEVRLPVGYVHNSNVPPMPKNLVPISTLTYWSAEEHRTVTTSYEGRKRSASLPFELRENPGSFSCPKGETRYVGAIMVRKDESGRFFLDPRATIRTEPLGPEFGYSPDALIVRRTDGKGFEVKMPKGYARQNQEVEYMIPVMVSFADTELLVPTQGSSKQLSV